MDANNIAEWNVCTVVQNVSCPSMLIYKKKHIAT